ncbi:MAG: CehA/McbA family metallohydrolase [Minicystis sp.]
MNASVVALAVGLVAGTALDSTPPRTVETRGGYRVLEADFHAHTRFSDGFLSPFDLVLQARRRGLDALAITEHNMIFPGKMARWFSRLTGGPTILVGEEVTTFRYHVHGIGLTEPIRAGEPLAQLIADVHRQGGVVIAAHPVKSAWPSFEAELDGLDGTELMHPLAFGSGGAGWRWEDMRAFYERSLASGHPLTAIGSSDYHFFSPLGVCRTLVFARDDDEEAVLEAIRQGHTVVHDLQGKAHGDPALIRLLESEPYLLRPQDYGYRGSGPLDRGSRLLGWAGMLGLILFRRRRAAG